MYLPLPLPLPLDSPDQAHSFLRAFSRLLGWSYFLAWGVSFYPQALINYRRKSVTGLAIDFFTVNILGFTCYLTSCLLFLYSTTVRDQYARRHPLSPEPTVRWNDLAFATHATLMSIVTYSQFWLWGYKRDTTQNLSHSMLTFIISCLTVIASAVLAVSLSEKWEWIDVVYALQYVKIAISIVKYVPQALLNYRRKATTGWSIENILLDLSGGTLSLAQLVVDSSLGSDWSGLIGNPVKFFLGQVSILFDLIFITQHYILYRRPNKAGRGTESRYGTTAGVLSSKGKGLDIEEEEEEEEEEERDGERRRLLVSEIMI